MILKPLTPEAYDQAFTRHLSVYASAKFAMLNRDNADSLLFLASLDSDLKPQAGIILGHRRGTWHSPFSAPYSEISFTKEASIADIQDFTEELQAYLGDDAKITITLPPLFRTETSLQKTAAAIGNLAKRQISEYNYHYPLSQTNEYTTHLKPAAARNLRRSQTAGFVMTATTDFEKAYSIINRHHQEKGYRMSMTLEKVEATSHIVPTDLFILTHLGKDIAAVIMHHPAPGIVQLINWGDLPGNSNLRPMNYLAHALCNHYANFGLDTLDFGPASTDGMPNYGLCRFKESIGCQLSIKPTFIL